MTIEGNGESEGVEHLFYWTHMLWVSLLVTETMVLVTTLRAPAASGYYGKVISQKDANLRKECNTQARRQRQKKVVGSNSCAGKGFLIVKSLLKCTFMTILLWNLYILRASCAINQLSSKYSGRCTPKDKKELFPFNDYWKIVKIQQ